MPHATKIRPSTLVLCILLGACSSAPSAAKTHGPPPEFRGSFPARAELSRSHGQVVVVAEASYVGRHERMLGAELTQFGILPVRLSLGLTGKHLQQTHIQLDAKSWNLRLVLPDGSLLRPVSEADLEGTYASSARAKMEEHSLRSGPLLDLRIAREKELFVYFKLPETGWSFQGDRLLFQSSDQKEQFKLAHALLAFDVQENGQPLSIRVGLQTL